MPAINSGPDVHEAKAQLVLAVYLCEIDRTGPHGLRHDVIVQTGLCTQRRITLRLELREAWRDAIDERGKTERGRLETKTLGGGLLDVPVYAEIRAQGKGWTENVAVTDVSAVAVIRSNNARARLDRKRRSTWGSLSFARTSGTSVPRCGHSSKNCSQCGWSTRWNALRPKRPMQSC